MTAAIYTTSEHLWGLCAAYFEVYGHAVRRIAYRKPAKADVVIVDHLSWLPLSAFDCKLMVVVSHNDMELPPGSWHYRRPVDLDVMMDRILSFIEK